MSICQNNGCKGVCGWDHGFHPSHTLATVKAAGRDYVHCAKPDCNADDIQDGEMPCPAPLRSNAWLFAIQGVKDA